MIRLVDLIETKATTWLVIGAVAVFLLLLMTGLGLYPVVFADEYTYSKYARLAPFAESPIPGYLYLLIYRTTNICGSEFLSCARVLNAFFFVSAAPFIYLVARLVVKKLPAMMVALFAIAAPINSYTAYFMPEAAYFLSFWIFVALFLTQRVSSPTLHNLLCGFFFGILSLVKPHALFLLPAVVVHIAHTSWRDQRGWSKSIIKKAIIFLLVAGTVKFGISYAIAGRPGLTIFGTLYSSLATSPIADVQHFLSFAKFATDSFLGHLQGISLLFGLPLAVSILSFQDDSMPDEARRARFRAIVLFSLSLLVTLMLVTALFSASVMGLSQQDDAARLHMRYYNFIFPLLLIVVAAQTTSITNQRLGFDRLAAAIPLSAILAYALFTRIDGFLPSFVDSPELRGMSANRSAFWILGTLSLASLALWVWRGRLGARLFFFVYMPLCTALAWYVVIKDLRPRINPDVYDRAGLFARQFLPTQERDKLVVVGENLAAVIRALFLVDSRFVSLQLTSAPQRDQKLELPPGTHWVLSFDTALPNVEAFFSLRMPGFVLTRMAADLTVGFASPLSLGIIEGTTGLSGPETGGAWSTGKSTTLQFSGPLPERFTLRLVGHAFGPNVGRRMVVRIGESAVEFELGALAEVRELELPNSTRSSTLTIDVPAPTSPSELGIGSDQRKLGLKLSSITIIPVLPRAAP